MFVYQRLRADRGNMNGMRRMKREEKIGLYSHHLGCFFSL